MGRGLMGDKEMSSGMEKTGKMVMGVQDQRDDQ